MLELWRLLFGIPKLKHSTVVDDVVDEDLRLANTHRPPTSAADHATLRLVPADQAKLSAEERLHIVVTLAGTEH